MPSTLLDEKSSIWRVREGARLFGKPLAEGSNQGGVRRDDTGVSLVGLVLQLLGTVAIIKHAAADLASGKGDNLGGLQETKPAIPAFRGVKIWVCEPFNGVKETTAHCEAVQPQQSAQRGISTAWVRPPVLQSGPVPDRISGGHLVIMPQLHGQGHHVAQELRLASSPQHRQQVRADQLSPPEFHPRRCQSRPGVLGSAARAMPPRVRPKPARAAQPSRRPAGKGTWSFPPGPAPAALITGAPAQPLLAQPVSSNMLRRNHSSGQ